MGDLHQPKRSAEVHSRRYRNGSIRFEVQKAVVAGDDNVRPAVHSTFENAVAVRIGRHHAEDSGRYDDAGDLGDHANRLLHAILSPCEITPQNLGRSRMIAGETTSSKRRSTAHSK